jgi:demethylmenaquinone methyltransferase/2-methoxy-6-polyprenyl-1,4-benzoquinol methylase
VKVTVRSKEEHVHSVFERIAPKYDQMNDLISFRRHRYWRKFTMDKLRIAPGASALDLCCGTCDWTIALSQASGSGRVVGLDFSPGMLEVGREKVRAAGLEQRIELVEGNAMELPFPDNSFDVITIGFGLRNVPDIDRVLGEMLRVVKPGGQVACLELSKPTSQPFKGLYYFYFRRILPLFGKLVARSYEQYKWLPESLVQFPDRHRLAAQFEQAGYADVQAYPLTGSIAALHLGAKKDQ